jgi:hypothetical protein
MADNFNLQAYIRPPIIIQMLKKSSILLIVFQIVFFNSYGQKIKSDAGGIMRPFVFASIQERALMEGQLKNKIDSLILTKADPVKESVQWQGAFWAMELMLYKPSKMDKLIPHFITKLAESSPEFQRSFLEMLYTLYPGDYNKNIMSIWNRLSNAKNQAMALEYLLCSDIKPTISPSDKISGTGWHDAYIRRLNPPLKKPVQNDFIDSSFLSGMAVLCSFQSGDRNVPGYMMIRKADGTWLTDENHVPVKILQLARAVSNLPYYLTNGNTPQGIYKVTGTDVSENKWIGPTTNIQMVMPFEDKNSFFGVESSERETYSNILGNKLTKFLPLYESYEAGKLGRTEIIAHGTTINPDFYQGQKYYPCTPSLGCLCAPELWKEDGSLSYSAQQQIIDALQENNLNPEWLVVAEIEDFNPPVMMLK